MTTPAQVSGPGAYSKRTDSGGQPIRRLPDAEYGEAQAYEETQKGAPLAASAGQAVPNATPAPSKMPGPAGGEAPGPPAPMPGLFDMGAPGIPVTAGAPSGPGPNDIAGLPMGQGADFEPTALRDALQPYVAADTTGILTDTIYALADRGLW